MTSSLDRPPRTLVQILEHVVGVADALVATAGQVHPSPPPTTRTELAPRPTRVGSLAVPCGASSATRSSSAGRV